MNTTHDDFYGICIALAAFIVAVLLALPAPSADSVEASAPVAAAPTDGA